MLNWVPEKGIDSQIVNDYIAVSIKSNQFTNNGPCVQKLESLIRDKFRVSESKAVVAVCNGSVALHILSEAISLLYKKRLTWATQSFTFPPSAQCGLNKSKIIDIDDFEGPCLEELRNNDVDGLIVTNIFGNVIDINKYENWAKTNGKILIFDNAATAYTFYKGRNAINYGHGSTISFHHTKPFGFGEGGAIICDKSLENNVRCLINFGIGLCEEEYYQPNGTNAKMSDIAAVYIIQHLLNNFHRIVDHHRYLYKYLRRRMNELKITHFRLFTSYHDLDDIVPACFAIILQCDSEKYIKRLLKNNIYCRRYYYPLKMTLKAKQLFNSILCFPCTTDTTTAHIETILRLLSY